MGQSFEEGDLEDQSDVTTSWQPLELEEAGEELSPRASAGSIALAAL